MGSFSKDMIDDIVKLRPNPGDGHPTLKMAEKGVSMFACIPCTHHEIESLQIREQAADESKLNLTEAKEFKLSTTDSWQ